MPSASLADAGFSSPPMTYRLVRSAVRRAPVVPSEQQRRVIEHDAGRLRVLAGPGTGKTATIVEAVADRVLRRGVDPGSIVVLTFSRRAARELAERLSARLAVTTSEPLVRTLHSYAYSLVVSAAAAAGEPPPRLLAAGQSDLMVREMLAGHADEGGRYWPPELHAALRVPSFAAELRDVLLRVAERRLSSRQVTALARRHGRPEWGAVARFMDEYRDIGDLRQGTGRMGAALDQAELTTAALDRLGDPAVLARQQSRFRRVFVDEYQDVDPAQADLIELLASGADELVVVGDPDQSIYAFRGAAPGAMDRIDVDDEVALTVSHRMPATLLAATRRVASLIPGRNAHRDLTAAAPDDPGTVTARVLSSAAQEAAYVADCLRRAHIESAVPWSRMAVLLRSPLRSGEQMNRALQAADIPVRADSTAPLMSNPMVRALITVLRVGIEPAALHGGVATTLLASPLGGMDPVSVRRLRRAIRAASASDETASAMASSDILAAILRQERPIPAGLAVDLAAPLRRMTTLIGLARSGSGEPAAETVLWEVWQSAKLADGLRGEADRGGRRGARAAGYLDATIALFDRAAELADQLPSAGVRGLLEVLEHEQIPEAGFEAAPVDAVSVVSAHAAKGLEWDVVAVAGVQRDLWPDTRPRATVLGVSELLDAASGFDTTVPAAGRLADERRLFYVAVTRARRELVVTAVRDDESEPSRFVADLLGTDEVPTGWPQDRHGRPRRPLHLSALVADLRAAVTHEGGNARRVSHAAAVLAELSRAGIAAADPRRWYGLASLSTEAPLVDGGAPVAVSPSQVESLLECPLRTALTRHGGRPAPDQPQLLGIAVHALAEGIAAGATSADVDAAVGEFLAAQDHLPPWEVARLGRRMATMRQALETWVQSTADTRTFVASETPIDVTIPVDDGHPIELRGRIDWLAEDSGGRLVITDFKSGSTPPTKADAERHPQLAVYQLAVALGALGAAGGETALGDAIAVGGAELVYVRSGKPVLRTQAAQTAESRAEWIASVRAAAEASIGPQLVARQGEYCDRCPVRSSCPLQPEGRQVTG